MFTSCGTYLYGKRKQMSCVRAVMGLRNKRGQSVAVGPVAIQRKRLARFLLRLPCIYYAIFVNIHRSLLTNGFTLLCICHQLIIIKCKIDVWLVELVDSSLWCICSNHMITNDTSLITHVNHNWSYILILINASKKY